MGGKSNYLEGQLLNLILRTQAAWKPSAVFIALLTAAPTDAGGGTEVSGGNYARVQVAQADASWAAPAGTPRATSNAASITFPTPSANWGSITHFAIYDASTSGNLLYWAALSAAKTVNNGDPAPYFPAGSLTVSED